jgi:hypothetical protein
MDVLNQKQWLESTNCVVEFFSIIFRNVLKNRFKFFEFFEKIFFEKWTTSNSGCPQQQQQHSKS